MKIGFKTLRLVLILIISTLLFLTSACTKAADKAVTTETKEQHDVTMADGKIKANENGVEYKSDDGEISIDAKAEGEVTLPEGYPSDIAPVYPNSKLFLAAKQGNGYTISMKTNDSVADICKFYEKNVKFDGSPTKQDAGNTAMIIGICKELNVVIMIAPNEQVDESKYIIAVSVGE